MLRTVLFVTSVANMAAGLGLAGLYFRFSGEGGVPFVVLLVALSLLLQGGFTIGYLRGLWSSLWDNAAALFVAGEWAAALVGAFGTLQGILYNLNPRNGDFEFGPLMAAFLIGTHAAVGLLYAARTEPRAARSNHRA